MLTVQADLSGSVIRAAAEHVQTQRPCQKRQGFFRLLHQCRLDRQCPFCTHSGQQGNTDFVHRLRLALIYRNLIGFIFRFRLLTQATPAGHRFHRDAMTPPRRTVRAFPASMPGVVPRIRWPLSLTPSCRFHRWRSGFRRTVLQLVQALLFLLRVNRVRLILIRYTSVSSPCG